MANFCEQCGSKIDQTTGLCPNCNKAKKRNKKNSKNIHRKSKKNKIWKWLLGLLVIIILACGIIGGFVYFDLLDIPFVKNVMIHMHIQQDEDIEYSVEAPDAEEYYENNSVIVSEIDINASENVYTEAAANDLLTNRGFDAYEITTEYSMDGTYYASDEIEIASTEKHPIYETYYITENNELWTVFLIDGAVMASPISYNLQSELNVQIIFSEKETVTSYDSTTNKFFETIPNESVLKIITVDMINADLLNYFTVEEINYYV